MRKHDEELKDFIELLLNIPTKEEMLNFLEGILTPAELEEIPNRLKIVKMIKQGTSQREIADSLGVGIATVTRGSREVKRGKFSVLDKN